MTLQTCPCTTLHHLNSAYNLVINFQMCKTFQWHTHCRMNCSYSNEHDTARMVIVAIVIVNSAMLEAKRTKIYPQNAGSL